MSSYVIGLTGGIACGKTNLSDALRNAGAPVIDADMISRSLTAPSGEALPAIRKTFGEAVFDGENLNRRALGNLVFSNPDALSRLNAITHPLIFQKMKAEMDRHPGPVVLDVPLLFEANMQHMGDLTACVTVPQEVQIARLNTRNGFDRETALARIRSQMPVSEKAARSDVIINADQPLEALAEMVRKLYEGWLAAARKENA